MTWSAGTNRNSAFGSTNLRISHGQATRSTCTCSRVIHFISLASLSLPATNLRLTRRHDAEQRTPCNVLEREVHQMGSRIHPHGVRARQSDVAGEHKLAVSLAEHGYGSGLRRHVEASPTRVEGQHVGVFAHGLPIEDLPRAQVYHLKRRVALVGHEEQPIAGVE